VTDLDVPGGAFVVGGARCGSMPNQPMTEEETVTEETAPDYEPTGDGSFRGDAADQLGDATEGETEQTADEEDGSSPSEPQPESHPMDDEPRQDDSTEDEGGGSPAAPAA